MAFIERGLFQNESAFMKTGNSRHVDILMKVTGERQGVIKGESQDAVHKDSIEIQSFQYGLMLPYDSTTGLAAGKRQHRPMRILKQTCAATPLLFMAAFNNENLKEVVLLIRKSGGGAVKNDCYLTYTLTQARIIDFKTGFMDGSEILPVDHFAFVFSKFKMEYKPQKDGKLGAAISASDEILAR